MERNGKLVNKARKVTPKNSKQRTLVTAASQKFINQTINNHGSATSSRNFGKFPGNNQHPQPQMKTTPTNRKIFQNNDWYEGNIQNNLFEGKGTYFISSLKLEYHGNFKNGLFEGQGTIIDVLVPYRQVYHGWWKEGKKNGSGTYQYSQTQKYTGQWRNNAREGYGQYESIEGSYKGNWKNDKKHGDGTLKMKRGISLIGQWEDDEFKEGKIIYSDGSLYNGSVKSFSRDGKGEYEYTDGSRFSGEWKNNQKHGTGIYEYEQGDYYEGGFRDNMKHGQNCVYHWKEGQEIRNGSYNQNTLISGEFFDVNEEAMQFDVL